MRYCRILGGFILCNSLFLLISTRPGNSAVPTGLMLEVDQPIFRSDESIAHSYAPPPSILNELDSTSFSSSSSGNLTKQDKPQRQESTNVTPDSYQKFPSAKPPASGSPASPSTPETGLEAKPQAKPQTASSSTAAQPIHKPSVNQAAPASPSNPPKEVQFFGPFGSGIKKLFTFYSYLIDLGTTSTTFLPEVALKLSQVLVQHWDWFLQVGIQLGILLFSFYGLYSLLCFTFASAYTAVFGTPSMEDHFHRAYD